MTIQRMDHVGVNVDDLAAAKAFFVELGLEVLGDWSAESGPLDRVVGFEGARTEVSMLQTPDGHGRLELIKWHAPPADGGDPQAPPNAHGIRHLTFELDDLDAALASLRSHGSELVGEVEHFEDAGYRTCYLRGPEGIIVELAEKVG